MTDTIGVALTTDQLEDAKLGRALRELLYDGHQVVITPPVSGVPHWTVEARMGASDRPTLLEALAAARRELQATATWVKPAEQTSGNPLGDDQ